MKTLGHFQPKSEEQMNSEYVHHAIAFLESYNIVDKDDESLFTLQREIIKVMFEHPKCKQ